MHNGNFEQKNDGVPYTTTTTTASLIPAGSAPNSAIGFLSGTLNVGREIAVSTRAVEELSALERDVSNLLQTEGPKIVRLTEILTRQASTLFPFAEGENIPAQILSAITQLMTFGINPAAVLFGAQQAVGMGIASTDQGQHALASAMRSAGEPTFDAFDACVGLYSLYNTYTELNRLYASVKFCIERLKTSAQEMTILTGSDAAFEEVQARISEWWNAPGSILDYLAVPDAMLERLKSVIDLYESMEPLRMASYFAITAQAEPNTESQLDQVTHLLTNACYNTLLDNIGAVSNSVGNSLGRVLPAVGINKLKQLGTKAALTASVTAVAGMSCPITVAILATCATNQKTRGAFIAYAKSLVGETKSDDSGHLMVSRALSSLENGEPSLFNRFNANISEKINTVMEKCASVSGSVTGNIVEQAIRTLMNDSECAPILRDQLDSVIYQILDGTLRQTLQIPEQKAYLEKMAHMNPEEAVVYQACGAMIPNLANLLALPDLVEHQLQAATGNPHICSINGKPLNFREKAIQGVTRALRLNVEGNLAAASVIFKGGSTIVNKGLILKKAIMGENTAELDLTLLGSSANRESNKFDYVKQTRLQQETLIRRQKRAKDQKQAAELQNLEEAAIQYGFNKAYFEQISNIQDRSTKLLETLDAVDSWCIEKDVPDSVATYVREYLANRSYELLGHIETANKLFENLELDKNLSIRGKLVTIKKTMHTLDAMTIAPEAKVHYLALLKLRQDPIAALDAPLEALYNNDRTDEAYAKIQTFVEDYLKENPTNVGLILAEVSYFKTTFWAWQSYDPGLIKLEKFLLERFAQNKPAENDAPSITVHLPKEESLPSPTLIFSGVQQPSVSFYFPVEHKHEDEEQRAVEAAVLVSEKEAMAADKIGPKTIRVETPALQCHFVSWDGIPGNTKDEPSIPQGQIVAEIAYTGNHYLSVKSKPAKAAALSGP
jgi:hypothetical protein